MGSGKKYLEGKNKALEEQLNASEKIFNQLREDSIKLSKQNNSLKATAQAFDMLYEQARVIPIFKRNTKRLWKKLKLDLRRRLSSLVTGKKKS